jgi:hypothetical protein
VALLDIEMGQVLAKGAFNCITKPFGLRGRS